MCACLAGGAVRNACLQLKADLEAMLDAYVESQSDPAPWVGLLCTPSQINTRITSDRAKPEFYLPA